MGITLSEKDPLIQIWEEGDCVHMDVRLFLLEGGEPFPYIMEALDQLEKEESLVLHTPFEPFPLYRVLERKGFLYSTTKLSEDHFEVKISHRS
jgi:uncharacterized protein (DUF2249 family)